ncbi:LacI family DNA-binding transcriptional regulator [Nocardiopsis sp. FIRDI 009]|uniref:LacI family DNA-binding transcriptional regulator n=1 Tax=Nocardiopsis sp. FIRDI 009 TaxID=714197 RepID=UPI0018E5A5D5|nr:LacI family DNA-binding transcriptional regulator [Nocardiopsis sp. FIRDI 009]
MSAVTIVDVARAAGVSKTTASDALRGRGRVSEATRESVVAAARRLGYATNRSARSLRTSTTGAIGLYIPQVLVRSEYYLAFVHGVLDTVAVSEYDVTLMVSAHHTRRAQLPRADGLILCDPVHSDPMASRLVSSGLPVVTCERMAGARPTGVVWSDHGRQAGRLLDHLRDHGARRIALLASATDSDWARSIESAYHAWCRAHRYHATVATVAFGTEPEALRREVATLLDADPDVDALVCASDGVAAAVAPSLASRGLRVGEDFLLASCVDSSALRTMDPPVTAVDPRGEEAGAACGRLLLDILADRAPEGTFRELELGFVPRASTLGGPRGSARS